MRHFAAIVALALLALVPASAASANADQESTMQDDSLLVYGTPAEQSNALDMMKALGADRVRVTVYWRLIAPDAGSTTKPKFEATDPDAYPSGAWDRYDTLVRLAAFKGIGVNFNVSAPAPAWATSDPPRDDVADVSRPDATEFGKFVQALGTRYSGGFTPKGAAAQAPSQQSSPPSNTNPLPPLPTPPATAAKAKAQAHAAQAATGAVPRVGYWSLWNEPNQGGWLAPQWQAGQPWSPRMYRALVDYAYPALVATGHGGDVILVGETAPKGSAAKTATAGMKPLDFLRYLYCVDQSYRPLQGAEADAAGCPSTNNGPDFVAAHPGLFAMTGLAHHPYNFPLPPNLKSKDKNFAAIADTPRLVKFINRIMVTYNQGRQGGIPIFFTEYGYQTRPPDPLGVSWTVQAAYLDESEYMAWNFGAVHSTNQFLLVDDKPNSAFPPGSIKYWGTFQTGLLMLDGSKKTSFFSYPAPIWLPKTKVRPRRQFLVWGMRRAGNNGEPQAGRVEYQAKGRSKYKRLKTIATSDPRGYVETKVKVPRSGSIRIAWVNPSGGPSYSRPVKVTTARKRR